MNIETHRKSIIHRILDIQNEDVLNKIDQILMMKYMFMMLVQNYYLFQNINKKLNLF